MKYKWIIILVFLWTFTNTFAKLNSQGSVLDDITDAKDLKKILRTKNNVLICFIENSKSTLNIVKVFKDVAEIIKGQGTMVLVDCSGDAKKMCKKLKVSPEPYVLKHYKNGEFHKDYDRRESVSSLVNFMRDPTGDLPWEEDPSAQKVVHIADAQALRKFLKKEMKPVMIMFYAPWCGFCKTLKPEYAQAATELDGHSILAAIDVNRPENAGIRSQYNITGFPTLLYYELGKFKQSYEGENTKSGLVQFMKNPTKPSVKPINTEGDWSDTDSEVVHLTSDSFEPALKDEPSVLVMFYAPWCGHCKKMKPEYEKAAADMKNRNIPGVLAALDATKEPTIASQFKVKGYPTIKYFVNGEYKYDANVREADKIIEFMKNPQEPPPPPPPEKPWSEEESEVFHLDEDTFKPFMKKKKYVLTMFYAPWCGHCKKAKPEFTQAAEKFKDDAKINFAAVDCTQHRSVCSAMDVSGYPTFKCFLNYNKGMQDYNGGRTESDFVKYMSALLNSGQNVEKKGLNSWEHIEGAENIFHLTDDTFDSFMKTKDKVLLFVYGSSSQCKKIKPEFAKSATELRKANSKYALAALDRSIYVNTVNSLDVQEVPIIMLFENGKFISNYKGKLASNDIIKYILTFQREKDEL
ncbi:protein disulfide-isomerase A5-like [Ctenocephalides felis]|uniref:protein disulfide-isomerase A5-like n=1 Tax=Ctenocephalides felis TaxID=7515 RepID=UPI000E6E3924|nr:protein disulfide-isomerase A5-like [Ctenocephalides felis]